MKNGNLMQITKQPNGDVAMSLNLDELNWLGQALNECCHGFPMQDFHARIGVDRNVAVKLLDQIVAMYPSTISRGA